MVGFNYKSLVLQIIHGSVLLGTIIIAFDNMPFLKKISDIDSTGIIIFSIFILASFVIGVIIDFFADCIESIFIWIKLLKPPVFYLLKNGNKCGIVLAHNTYILKKLCRVASKHYEEQKNEHEHEHKSEDDFFKEFNKNKWGTVNYILQVAKNRAFRKCKDVQKDQIDSFFMLYVFSRNFGLSLLITFGVLFNDIFCKDTNTYLLFGFALIALVIFFILASYRYYLYYSRILLGSTFKAKCS